MGSLELAPRGSRFPDSEFVYPATRTQGGRTKASALQVRSPSTRGKWPRKVVVFVRPREASPSSGRRRRGQTPCLPTLIGSARLPTEAGVAAMAWVLLGLVGLEALPRRLGQPI